MTSRLHASGRLLHGPQFDWRAQSATSSGNTFEYLSHNHLRLEGLPVSWQAYLVLLQSTFPWKGRVGYIGCREDQEQITTGFLSCMFKWSLIPCHLFSCPLSYLLCPFHTLSTLSMNLELIILNQEIVWCQLSIVQSMVIITVTMVIITVTTVSTCYVSGNNLTSNLQNKSGS